MMYTNADQLLNKMHFLEVHVSSREPDILVITEVIPKAQKNPIPRSCLALKGYTEFFNFRCDLCGIAQQGRGIAVYVKQGLKAYEEKCHGTYRDQLWVKLILDNQEHVLIGAIYRSPSASLEDTVPDLISVMSKAVHSNPPYLIICGDFNIKAIDWKLERYLPGAPPITAAFLQGVKDNLLFQHVLDSTRFRDGQNPQILDLIFSNEENIVQDIEFLPGLGHSDTYQFSFP